VTQEVPAAADTVAVNPLDLAPLSFYLDPAQFDPDAANCDAISVDGYGQGGCEEQSLYEYKKISINLDGEWMIIERIDDNILTVRRATEARQDHPAPTQAYFWEYGNFDRAPLGYFAWLRAQPGFGGQTGPYQVQYWEVGNEPFWAIVDGNGDGVLECNFWFPCVPAKSSLEYETRVAEYIRFYDQVASFAGPWKFGLDLRAYLDFSNLAFNFEDLPCATTIQGWNRDVLQGIQGDNLDFVAPHYYIFVPEHANNLALVTHPDRFVQHLRDLDQCLQSDFSLGPEIVANEFGVFYNESRGYGWWSELNDRAGKWRDALFLASHVSHLMPIESVTAANYWNLVWPGFMGKPGDQVYPFMDQFYTRDFTEMGPTFEVHRQLVRHRRDNVYLPASASTYTLTTEVTTPAGVSETLVVEPLLAYALRSDSPPQQYALILLNRSEQSIPVSVTLGCSTCVQTTDWLARLELSGLSYDSPQIETHSRPLPMASSGARQQPGVLTLHDTLEPLSVVIVSPFVPFYEAYLPLVLRGR
jgi:hypothetical protein